MEYCDTSKLYVGEITKAMAKKMIIKGIKYFQI